MQKAPYTVKNNKKDIKELEAKVNSLENELLHLRSLYTQLYNRQYRSLYQRLKKFIHFFFYGSKAWLTFAPGSRPRRVLDRLAINIVFWLQNNRLLAKMSPALSKYFPSLALKIKQILNSPNTVFKQMTAAHQKILKEIITASHTTLKETPHFMHLKALDYMVAIHNKMLEQMMRSYDTTLSTTFTLQQLTPQGAIVYSLVGRAQEGGQ